MRASPHVRAADRKCELRARATCDVMAEPPLCRQPKRVPLRYDPYNRASATLSAEPRIAPESATERRAMAALLRWSPGSATVWVPRTNACGRRDPQSCHLPMRTEARSERRQCHADRRIGET